MSEEADRLTDARIAAMSDVDVLRKLTERLHDFVLRGEVAQAVNVSRSIATIALTSASRFEVAAAYAAGRASAIHEALSIAPEPRRERVECSTPRRRRAGHLGKGSPPYEYEVNGVWLTVQELVERTGMHYATVYRKLLDGVPPTRVRR